MKILCVLLAVSFFTTVLSEDPNPAANSTIESISPTDNSTASSPISTETTVTAIVSSPSTEVSPSASTELSSSTSTVVPSTPSTVVSPTTSTELLPTTSTVAPPTTSTEPSSSTVAPTTDPTPKKCTWNITEADVTCIRAEIQAQFVIDIKGQDKHTINLGCEAVSLVNDCSSNKSQILMLSEKEKYTLTMVFEEDAGKFSVRNITFDFTLPDGKHYSVFNDAEKLFSVKVGNSYLCKSNTDVHLENVVMKISDIHVQAFAKKDSSNFGTADECSTDVVSDIIPIAVGIALITLVLVVLIAYLVGRRRKSQKGYQNFQE